MITAADLRSCRSARDASRLFARLGWPVEPRRIDPREWPSIDGAAIDGADAWHLTRHAGVDLYAFEAREERSRGAIAPFLRGLSRWNRVLEPTVVYFTPSRDTMSLFGRRGTRRLDVALDTPSADAVDRIASLQLAGAPSSVDPRQLITRALDREATGRRFFDRFRRSLHAIDEAVSAARPRENRRATRDHALLLLSRLLFLYFLQRKGWLDGSHRFLSDRLERAGRGSRAFHERVLRPLFFDCLSTPLHRRPPSAAALGAIPYLNGGLFARSSFEQRHASLALSDALWREVIDETFERFTFCADEDDEEGVHIDPEMLGRVFESLMESGERAESGTFYTPRPLVDRLTADAVAGWCAGGDRDVACRLLAVVEGESGAGVTAEEAPALLEKLETITVLDAACGSGAFLLSALRIVERLTRHCAGRAGVDVERDLRARIVERSIFGVDLKSEAVRLCELRLWLAIVSASGHDATTVPPLPNLDRNVMQGNTLAGPLDFLGGGRVAVYREWSRALRRRQALVDGYKRAPFGRRDALARRLRESDRRLSISMLEKALEADRTELASLEAPDVDLFGVEREPAEQGRREALKERIAATARSLARAERGDLEFFAFDVHFAGVMAEGGFRVALGNPPWVRSSRVDPSLRRACAERYGYFRKRGARGFAQAELALAFVEKSLALLAPGGVFAQLLPSKVLTADYAATMRRDLARRHAIVALRDWSRDGKRLFGADVFPLGLVVRKEGADDGPVTIEDAAGRWEVSQRALAAEGSGAAWSIAPPECRALMSRLRERFPPLSIALGRMPLMGVKTGANGRFFLGDVVVTHDGVRVPALGVVLPDRAVVRCVRGRDLRRWSASGATWMLWPPSRPEREEAWLAEVACRLGCSVPELRLDYVHEEHLGLRVAWKDLSRGLEAAVLPATEQAGSRAFALVPNQTVYSIACARGEEAFALSALLNSSVFDALCVDVAERAKDDHFRYLAATVAAVPLPAIRARSAEEKLLSRLAARSHAGEALDREIDRAVAALYGLSDAELALLERFASSRRGERRS